MLFEGPSAKLPTATLRPSAVIGRRRAMVADLDRWLSCRAQWLWPRAVPLLAAFVGLMLTLGAVKYLRLGACTDDLKLRMREVTDTRVPGPCRFPRPAVRQPAYPAGSTPIRIVVESLKPGDCPLVLTLVAPDGN